MDLKQLFDKSHDGTPEQIAELSRRFAGRRPDPEMAAVLRVLISSDPKPFYELPPKLARLHPLPPTAVMVLLAECGERIPLEPVRSVENRTIPGPGGDVDVRIYRPADAPPTERLPVVLYIHGGGWVIADLDTYDASARAVCNQARAIVVSTHYRQAPEHKFPAAHEDTYAAYRWVLEHAASLGGDPARVAVVGESAGGNMAFAIAYRALRDGVRPPVHQVLVYPVADYGQDTESYREMTEAQPLNAPAMRWFFEQYLNSPADGASPLISAVDADLAGLPPATIINAELDPLRSEGERLAERMRAAGVPAEQRTFEGVTHEFFGMTPVLAKAREAQAMAGAALRKAFGDPPAYASPTPQESTPMSQPDGSQRPLAVVTGASSGIGRELAKVFARHGYDLVAAAEPVAHGGVTLDDAAGELRALGAQVDAVPVDLATTAGVQQLAARVQSLGRPVDALALNAGVGLGGAFLDQDLGRIFNLIDVNVKSTVHLAYRLLPGMVARRQGRVLITSSIAALMPGSFQAVYNASKAFDHSFAEAIRNELKDTGVTVTALQPGATETNFFHRADLDDTKVGASKKDDPAEVARMGFEAMMAGKDHVIAESLKTRLQGVLAEIVPEPLKAEQHRKMAEPGSASK